MSKADEQKASLNVLFNVLKRIKRTKIIIQQFRRA